MQLSLPLAPASPKAPRFPVSRTLVLGRLPYTALFVRHPRARHYLLRVEADGGLRVTVPRSGSLGDAERFVKHHAAWVERERYRVALRALHTRTWDDGTRVLVRGDELRLCVDPAARLIRLGDEVIPYRGERAGIRPAVVARLRHLASVELPVRLVELAAQHGFVVADVTVRDQKSRWGSCSPSGRISLNWRLLQLPPAIRDYVLVHELVHLRHPNHSQRFWRSVESLCPAYREARAWLRTATLVDPHEPR